MARDELVAGAVALVIVAAGVFLVTGVSPEHAKAPYVAADPDAAAPSAVATTGPFALGINEGVSIPNRILDAPGTTAEDLVAELASDAATAKALGARFIRGHTGAFPRISALALRRDPTALEREGDPWVAAVQAEGLEPVLMVSPWPGNRTANFTDHYLPDDMAAYEAYVARVVERYDGDGVDDMPGLLAPVRYFEVDNEPDLKFTDPPADARRPFVAGTFCTPEEYAAVLVASARAIRAASPEAKVLGGGVFRPHSRDGADYLRHMWEAPGAIDAVDIVSVHTYQSERDGRRLADALTVVRNAAPGKPIWVTETSTAIGDGVDAEEQGRLVAVLVGVAALGGAERVFWHTLADPPAGGGPRGREGRPGGTLPGGSFRTNSLLQTLAGGEREEKPAGAVYRALAKVLAEHDLVGAVADGQGAARLRDGSVLVWDGERTAPNGGVELRTGAAVAAGAAAKAPAFVW